MRNGEEHNTSATLTVSVFWQRIPIWIRATFTGVIVSSIGVFSWVIVGALIPAPWSILIMGILLWIYVKYFSGSWWPKSTARVRKLHFRTINLSREVWKWSLLCALLIVAFWQSSLVVTFRIIEFPGDVFTADYNASGLPIWIAWLMIIMAALVAGICEETGYRGFMQFPIESRYGPVAAITLVSIVFLIIHLQQAWAPPLLLHLFAVSVLFGILAYTSGSLIPGIVAHFGLDIFNFSYWWTDIAGHFDHRPISETGIDGHFIVWGFIFIISIVLFFWAIRKTKAARGDELDYSDSA